jgi:hypothetical protein
MEVAMHHSAAVRAMLRGALGLLVAATTVGCASRHDLVRDSFSAQAPYSKTIPGSGDTVCWSVKRAMLSQGYMLDRPAESGVLTGTRDFQPKPKLNVTLRMQTTCADNRDGTSIVFATATREDSRLQKMKQTTSVGVGPATLTMPSGSAQVLGVVSRKTIQDPRFYAEFFRLVDHDVGQERAAQARRARLDEQSEQARNQSNNDRSRAASR